MNYIGSKFKLRDFLLETIQQVVGEDLSGLVFCDLFAGTGQVGRYFKPLVKRVIANDLEYYSYVLNRHYIGNNNLKRAEELIERLNKVAPKVGLISINYCKTKTCERNYFKPENGNKIDGMRQAIEDWHTQGDLTKDEYYYLLTLLIEGADKVANTASVYGAYLKHIKKTAQKDLLIRPIEVIGSLTNHQVFNKNSNELITEITGDILYLDPPYNHRQYGANYHMLNIIARQKAENIRGVTGMIDYNKSAYSRKNEVAAAFEELIAQSKFKYIFLSYNNEGLMSPEVIQSIMSKYGRYDVAKKEYNRFRADKKTNRNHKADFTYEYLHILEK